MSTELKSKKSNKSDDNVTKSEPPKDLFHYKGVLTPDECAYYLKWANSPKRNWSVTSGTYEHRQVQHFGELNSFSQKVFNERSISKDVTVEVPDVLTEMFNIVKFRLFYFNASTTDSTKLKRVNIQIDPEIAQIYSYLPGQGVHQHFDSEYFKEDIVMISLGGTCTLRFSKPKNRIIDANALLDASKPTKCQEFGERDDDDVYDIFADPGTVFVLRGDSRYIWKHGIPKTTSDKNDAGQIVPRIGCRVSVVFREA